MNDRDFWIQVRRGLKMMLLAIPDGEPMLDRNAWIDFRRGVMTMAVAIERRWSLPRSSVTPLGAAQLLDTDTSGSPPPVALTRSAHERIGDSDAHQRQHRDIHS